MPLFARTLRNAAASVQGADPAKGLRAGPHENGLIALLAVTAALTFFNRSGIALIFPQIKTDLHLNHTQLGSLMAVTALAWGVSSIVFSAISDWLGGRPKLIIIICVIGFSVVGGLAGSVSSFSMLLLLRTAMGVFEGPVIPLIQSAVSGVSSPHRRGANLGLIIGGSQMLSGVLAPSIMVGLTQTVGWRNAFHLLAIPGLLVALGLVFLMIADRPSTNHKGISTGTKHAGDILRLFAKRNVALGLVGAITLIGYAVSMTSFLPLFLNERTAMSAGGRVFILTILAAALALGAIIAPALSDRFGRKPCAIVATLALSIGPLGLILAQHHIAFLALTFATSLLGGGALTLMVYVIPGESTPPNVVATLYAILLFVGEMTGGAIAPSLAGYLSDRFNVSAAMWLCSGFAMAAFLAALTVQKVDHRRPAA